MKQRRTVHLICQAHLDPVWIWHRRDGYSEALTTIGSAVKFLENEPDMRFTRSSAAVYRWIEEADPGLFRAIQNLVKAGRWEVVNGWEVQPDCNLPLGESFVRQSLYGKRWFQDAFGVDVRIGYNVDTFGHSGNLPQLLVLSGMDAYVCMRPFRNTAGLPYPNLFWWESPDGSRVLCWRIPRSYGQSPAATADDLERQLRHEAGTSFPSGIDHAPFFLGVGNHGGGPTRRLIDRIRELQEDPSLPEIRFSTLGEYFSEVRRAEAIASIPVLRQGLQYVNIGCYAAHGIIKRASRRTERSLLKAEFARSMVRMTGLKSQPDLERSLLPAWRSLLFNQFHDILGGTCVASADTGISDEFGHAAHMADSSLDHALHRLARNVDTSWAEKGVLTLFNPLPWKRQASVAFDTFVVPTGEAPITHLRDAIGRKVAIQWTAAETCFGPMGMEWRKLQVIANLPAFGYRAFSLGEGTAPRLPKSDFSHVRISRRHPGLSRLGLKGEGNLLSRSMRLEILKDSGDTWGHNLTGYDEALGEAELIETKIMEAGPLVRITRQEARWRDSSIVLYFTLRRARREVDLRIVMNWQEPRQLLRLVIPTCFRDASQTLASEPGGQVSREADGGEKPAHEWLAIGGRVGGRARSLGLVADRPISYCCRKGVIGVTLARSSFYAHHHPREVADPIENPCLDTGRMEYRMTLVAGTSIQSLNLHRLAWEADCPAERVVDHGHQGALPAEASLLEVHPASVAIYAIKPAEDGRDLILRIQETRGRRTEARVKAGFAGRLTWEGRVSPWQILSLRIPLDKRGRRIRETGLLE
ncbi:MAG: hypothetical protein R3F07_19100 [Opitutaceae bacterium]